VFIIFYILASWFSHLHLHKSITPRITRQDNVFNMAAQLVSLVGERIWKESAKNKFGQEVSFRIVPTLSQRTPVSVGSPHAGPLLRASSSVTTASRIWEEDQESPQGHPSRAF